MSKPFFPWVGGKRRLADKILPLFPEHVCYVEAFAGAGALFFAKPEARTEVLNDVDGDVTNLYRVVKHHLSEFMRQFEWALVSRQIFEWTKATPPEALTDIQRAARFFYLLKTGFGARMTNPIFGTSVSGPPKLNLLRLEEDLSAAHLRLARATIERGSWEACIDRYDRPVTLFYLDPPYLGTYGYGVKFGIPEFEKMAERLRTLQGKAVVSTGDCREMRRIFKGFRLKSLEISYQVGGNRNRVKRRELVIRSW